MRSRLGKLRTWCAGGGPAPPDLEELCPEAWTADLPEELNGIKVLGTPLGRPAYVAAFAAKRMSKEEHLLTQIGKMHDPQCAWLMLSMSAVPRSNHMVRMLPPTQSAEYASTHDEAIWRTFCEFLGAKELQDDNPARDVAYQLGKEA